MAVTVVQNLEAAQNTGLATVTVSHSAATAGNLLVLIAGADDYRTTVGAGRPESSSYTLSTGCAQETFLGHYVWWKVAAGGETSVQYTIGSASTSCWEWYEFSGLTSSPFDISNGQLAGSAGNTYTTPAITPTAGDRYLLASMGGSLSAANPTGMGTWLNSFTELNDTANTLGSGTRDVIGAAALSVTANGSTAYSSGATYDATSPQTRTGIILAFKVAAAGTNASATEATASGAAQGPAIAVTVNATEATATGTALSPVAAVAGNATAATGSGAADGGLAAVVVNATEAAGTGTASNPAVDAPLNVTPSEAAGAGTAYGATVTVAGTATAGVATATGTAYGPLAGAVLFTTETPTTTNASDGTPGITTATSLTFSTTGEITAVRFFSTTTVGGTYTAGVWQAVTPDDTSTGTGTLLTSEVLATAPNPGEWTAIPLSSPVTVGPGVLYRIGVHNTDGRYVATSSFGPFVSGGLTNGDITAAADGTSPVGLGRLNQGTFTIDVALAYPQIVFGQANYYVDALFSADVAVTASPPEATGAGTAYGPTISASGSASATEAVGVGTAEWDAGSSISLDLTADNPVDGVGIAYDATVSTSSSASPAATEATATGSAASPAIALTVSATEATAAGAAANPSSAVAVNATEATAAGTGINPSVSTSSGTSASATEAVATGTAIDVAAAIATPATPAVATAEAFNPSVLIGGPGSALAGLAEAIGTAHGPRVSRRTPRPFTGTTARSFTGTTARPYAGTTLRP